MPRRATTVVIDGLQELPLDRYDAIILDQYGVLHNGEALLDGVAAALERLHAGGARKLARESAETIAKSRQCFGRLARRRNQNRSASRAPPRSAATSR